MVDLSKRDDEIWTTKDGREIPVGEMDEEHVRNTLRMILRKARQLRERKLYERLPVPDECFFERPDNPTILAGLRAKHGDAVRVEHAGVVGMDGGNVYVGDRHIGWFGGI